MKLPVGSDVCKCSGCGKYFNSTAAFDKHRHGRAEDRRCYSIDEMRERGMDVNARGRWVTALRDELAPDLAEAIKHRRTITTVLMK
jgi:hypothetical protein